MGVPELYVIKRKKSREEEKRKEEERRRGPGMGRRRKREEQGKRKGRERSSLDLPKVLSLLHFTQCSMCSDTASLSLIPSQSNPLPRFSLEGVLRVPTSPFYLIFLYLLSTSPVELCEGPLGKPLILLPSCPSEFHVSL